MSEFKRKKRVNKVREIICEVCNTTVITRSNVTKHCKSCARSIEWKRKHTKPEWRLKHLVSAARNRSKVKNVPFDIDNDYIYELYLENDGLCALTGQELDFTSWGQKGQVNPRAPSIDRIIPSLGYVRGNVRIITYHMNIALSEFGIEEFEVLLKSYLGNTQLI